MTFFRQMRSDKNYFLGLCLLAASCIIFLITDSGTNTVNIFTDLLNSAFCLSNVICWFYFIVMLGSGRLRKGRNGIVLMFIFLLLALLSAYTLNREIPVFRTSATWFSVLLMICCFNYLLAFFYQQMSRVMQGIHLFVMGISLLVFFYLAVYLAPQYILSAAFFWVLGIPLHSFVPLLLVIYTAVWISRCTENNSSLRICAWSGTGTAVLITCTYVTAWIIESAAINSRYLSAKKRSDLPAWMVAASATKPGFFTERILKTDIRYTTAMESGDMNDFFYLPRFRGGEDGCHDPLVLISTALGGRLNIEEEDRVNMLQTIFDLRHNGESRLWSGDGLYTQDVKTHVQIWPEYRMAYTDQEIVVSESESGDRWPLTKEAIYSFYLPEGAAVSTLSLWIDGKEEPAILSTRAKADAAYKTIVGVESRDPSLMHWQEGNRVSVRIFPVTKEASRKFRIGYTSPLLRKAGRLEYNASYFDGPTPKNAMERVEVAFKGNVKDPETYGGFRKPQKGVYVRNNSYNTNWRISMSADTPVSQNSFHFNGNSYQVKDYKHNRSSFAPEFVYLDINNAWSEDEFNQVLRMPGMTKVYASLDNKMIQLTADNREEIFNRMHQQEFSIFPFHLIEKPDTALVLTKSNGVSPNLNDLKASAFYDSIKTFAATGHKIRVFNLGNELSPYLRSLKEYRLFRYETGSLNDCSLMLARKEFSDDEENDQQILMEQSGVMITRTQQEAPSNAPDHLMRLFTYHHIMQQAGKGLLNGEQPADSLVEEASRAHVVTPVSSLVVLEKKADYDRFDIKDADGALKNAALGSKGAVPEPHEWMLIILAILILFYLKFGPVWKRKLN